MATVYQRLIKYCEIKNKPILTQEQRIELGHRVIKAYDARKKPEWPICHTNSVEDGITYRVISYPKSFIFKIDQLINSFYGELYPVSKRKRIIIKPNPIYSYRKKDNTTGESE